MFNGFFSLRRCQALFFPTWQSIGLCMCLWTFSQSKERKVQVYCIRWTTSLRVYRFQLISKGTWYRERGPDVVLYSESDWERCTSFNGGNKPFFETKKTWKSGSRRDIKVAKLKESKSKITYVRDEVYFRWRLHSVTLYSPPLRFSESKTSRFFSSESLPDWSPVLSIFGGLVIGTPLIVVRVRIIIFLDIDTS